MKLSDFDYALPRDLVASYPSEERSSARLLYVDRDAGHTAHHRFSDLGHFLRKGDLLVLNNTKVIPARLFGRKETGGRVEVLLLKNTAGGEWEALLRPSGRVKQGAAIIFSENGTKFEARVLDGARPDSGKRLLGFSEPALHERLEKVGHIPLPPYIDRPDSAVDRRLYQTVFAEKPGAVASPTAGLHFDQKLLDELQGSGVEIVFITLHVSYATFQPVAAEDMTRHRMDAEEFEISVEAADRINCALREERRIIACGTTTVRALESAVNPSGEVQAQRGETHLFIYPPHIFKVPRGLITNFHLPKSTLLLLVAAFLDNPSRTPLLASPAGEEGRVRGPLTGRDKLFRAYEEAILSGYRFYSYGDAMLIL